MAYKPGQNSEAVAAKEYNEKRLKKIYDEKSSHHLKEAGKISAFKEAFEGIKLEEQEFPQIDFVENIIENKFFLEGRKFGLSLIKGGFTVENYITYVNGKESKKHR